MSAERKGVQVFNELRHEAEEKLEKESGICQNQDENDNNNFGRQQSAKQTSSGYSTPGAQQQQLAAEQQQTRTVIGCKSLFSSGDSDFVNSRVLASTWDEEGATTIDTGNGFIGQSSNQVFDDDISERRLMPKPIDDVGLLYYCRQPIRLKDFSSEVRASMDVEQFAHQAELLLDLEAVSLDMIIDSMLNKGILSDDLDGAKQAGDELKLASIGPNQRQPPRPVRHDQSWLCALCTLAQLKRRHMVIARFKRPVNMGENAHHVRLFVLVLVPNKEKSTKDQLETGRTFATMLTDSNFRQSLIEARGEIHFKTLMILRAQQLALATQTLKNRHKYLLDAALHESISSVQLSASKADSPIEFGSKWQSRELSAELERNLSCVNGKRAIVFHKNPRTSKLFELISLPDNGSSNKNNNNNGNQLWEPSGADLDKQSKLAQLKQVSDDNGKTAEQEAGYLKVFCQNLEFGKSCWDDFRRRLRYYPSDFRDGFFGPPKTIQKTISTSWFLYFGILLPTIAFSSLNTTQTHGRMGDLRKALLGQAIGGLGFALLSGQPLVIIMTTAPLCLYTKVIHKMCQDYGFHFPAMYAAVGLWNGLFLVLYSMLGFSRLMKWCTRSTEEIFALFIVVAFITDAYKDMMKNFYRFYHTPACSAQNNQTHHMLRASNQALAGHSLVTNATQNDSGYRDLEQEIESSVCRRETSLLFVLLMLGTLWLSVTLYKFRRTPYLGAGKRDLLADYALPTAVIVMSLIGSTVFDDIYVEKFPPLVNVSFKRAPIEFLPLSGILTSLALGFTLSLLFFMDQNISAAMVNTPQNRLKKGDAFHYDLFIVGLLNVFLTLYGLPMMHGVLPHSPLHARSLADIEEQVEEGHLREVVVNARETRVTAIVAHILLFGSLLLIPYPIAYIPRAVLNGLFLYMAVTSLDGLQLFERIMLIFTEQCKYPPNHYIRRCPQKKIHQFTFMQLAQLLVMCAFGFSPFNVVEMFFPVIILLMIPFRHRIVPKFISEKYLEALDGKH